MGLVDHPLALSLASLVGLMVSARLGVSVARRVQRLEAIDRDDFGLVVGATLTLLGLIIGFTFSMALNRYDQRKSFEEEEANAIGTEYLRADLLPAADAAKVQAQLSTYLQQRIEFYRGSDEALLAANAARTAALQNELWKTVAAAAAANPSPVSALVAAGMNDVINTQGYTQAAWWNRIPLAAWLLMVAMAVCSTFLVGYRAQSTRIVNRLLVILPLVVSIAFLLIADIESPRGGFIHIKPQSLLSLADSIKPPRAAEFGTR
jgi:hypothetical protein